MTNSQKAEYISKDAYMPDTGFNREDLYDAAMDMAQWKDEQFKESVNKAMKRLEINLELTEAESTHIRKLFNF